MTNLLVDEVGVPRQDIRVSPFLDRLDGIGIPSIQVIWEDPAGLRVCSSIGGKGTCSMSAPFQDGYKFDRFFEQLKGCLYRKKRCMGCEWAVRGQEEWYKLGANAPKPF